MDNSTKLVALGAIGRRGKNGRGVVPRTKKKETSAWTHVSRCSYGYGQFSSNFCPTPGKMDANDPCPDFDRMFHSRALVGGRTAHRLPGARE